MKYSSVTGFINSLNPEEIIYTLPELVLKNFLFLFMEAETDFFNILTV